MAHQARTAQVVRQFHRVIRIAAKKDIRALKAFFTIILNHRKKVKVVR